MTEKTLPIDKHRVMIQQAKGTIKNIFDVVVELVTNSDDSFSKLEFDNVKTSSPKINVYVSRKTGGKCNHIIISDNASGMSKNELIKAIQFGGATSGFLEGKKVRGFFGRGLKEAIIALGEGKIITRKNDEISAVKIWVKGKGFHQKVVYDDSTNYSQDELVKWGLDKNDGTIIDIAGIGASFKIPDYKVFKSQIETHYALRDILSRENRNVLLMFYSERKKGTTFQTKLQFNEPKGKTVFQEKIKIKNHKVKLIIKESPEQLTTPYYNPFGLAGILVKSEGAILENTLFGHEKSEGARYFFGKLIDSGIATRLRAGEALINPNRIGLDWKAQYLSSLKNKVEEVFKIFVEKKQKELESKEATVQLTEKDKKFQDELCKLLNDLAKKELSDLIAPPVDPGELDGIDIRPLVANIKDGSSRSFTVYMPKWLDEILPASELKVESSSTNITIDKSVFEFKPHQDNSGILVSKFNVLGKKVGSEGTVKAKLGEYSTQADVFVVKELKKPNIKRKKYSGKKSGGFIKKIKPITDPNPFQRVVLDDLGTMKVYIAFPGISNYFNPWEKSMKTDVGRAVLSDLVLEGFCRYLTTAKQHGGELFDDSAETFNNEYFNLQKKFSMQIHKLTNAYYSK